MKKGIAFISAFLLLSSQPVINVYAEDTELKTLADSLGADTDALKIINYIHDEEHPLYKESYEQYLQQCTNVESRTAYMDFSMKISAGMCLGISTIEILSHNGILKPSDIKKGAEKLSDITEDKDSDYYITAYSASQGHFEVDTYMKYLTSMLTRQEQVKRLIDIAEKCMAENRYFLIKYDDLHSIQHAVAGIGIKKGEWQFNDNKYDICILTLDSNIASKETGLSTPFHEQGCIYINSETSEYYIPVYEFGSGDDGIYLVAIDDDALLGYKGLAEYNKEFNSTISELNLLRLKNKGDVDYNINVTEYNGDVHEIKEQVNEIRYAGYHDYYATGKRFEIDSTIIDETGRKAPKIELINRRSKIIASSKYNVRFIADENNFSLYPADADKKVNYDINILYNEGYYSTQSHFNWKIFGETDSYIDLSMKEKGLLISSDSEIAATIIITDSDWGSEKYEGQEFKFTSVNNVLLKNNEEDTFDFYIDPDGDNNYDKKVEKGDVNCDGIIDARDATAVLTDYALTSANKGYLSYVNADLADYDDNDIVDARDATDILTLYAEMSVK